MKKENIPNALTLVRIALIPVFVVILTFGHSYTMHILAAFIFAFASITDYLDGYLARKWEVVTNFGKFADPMADKLVCFYHVDRDENGSCLGCGYYYLPGIGSNRSTLASSGNRRYSLGGCYAW